MSDPMRRCGRCHERKTPECFYAGGNTWCRQCNREHHRERYAHAKQYGKTFKPTPATKVGA